MLSKRLRSILFVIFLLLNSSTIVHALEVEGVEVSGTASVDILSHYMWRGQQLSDKAVLQPVVEVTYGGFGFNFWSNYDLHTSENTETDYTLFYDFSLGKLNFEIGAIYYAIDSGEDTSEFYSIIEYDIFLNPTVSAYIDVDEGSGAWISAEIGHSFKLPRDTALNLGALVSYNIHHDVVGLDEDEKPFSDFSNAEFSASVSIPLWKAISIEPHVAYTFALSDDARDGFKAFSVDPGDETDTKLYGGIAITLAF